MKRTPLKRGKPLARTGGLNRRSTLKRTAMKRKRRKHDRPEVRQAFAQRQTRCACCGRRWGLESHHLLNGLYGRKDDERNLLRLCGIECHLRAEGVQIRGADGQKLPKLTLANCLHLKQESDPEWYDREWLQAAMGKRILPEAEAPLVRSGAPTAR